MQLLNRHILLGITGGVAAYKACELARRLQDRGATVQAVLSQGARHFVTPTLLHAVTGRPAFSDLWDERFELGMGHITLSRHADVLLVAPATAHFIGKLAHGVCDDLLCTLAVARPRERCRLVVVPAMNVEMWEHPATQRNMRQIVEDGATVLGPDSGSQACGETGLGRMLEPDEVVQQLIGLLAPRILTGRRILITAGPTFEPIDPVRGLTNRSSGRMGFAIAAAAAEAGASVTLVAGPVALPTPHAVQRIDVVTAEQMRQAVLQQVASADAFVAVAAVSDWRVEQASAVKLKKSDAGPPTLRLTANPDILAEVAGLERAPLCIGFAAETDQVQANARAKLRAKKVALIVANRAQETIGSDEAELTLIEEHGEVHWPRAPKLEQARRLVAQIAARLPERSSWLAGLRPEGGEG